ncbi:unnamed protein product [Cylindrotheca closterium]|uniref:DUF6824 domain-containing protein n=1 Tax=Cylindrotheca closterium TaxID=2856 RepID=A0AAD2G899_9STRA|nr:unnamed protein product [Cylindrotheca closterium]
MTTKSMPKRRRPRREIPEDLTNLYLEKGSVPSSLDVITRGRDFQHTYEKNQRYWRRILSERKGYMQLSKYEHEARNAIVESIYDYVRSSGGRFLQLDAKSGQWFQLPKKASMHEIQQALNERYVPYFARSQPQPQSSAPKKASRPDTSAFAAFLTNASSAPKPTTTSNFFSNFSQSSLQSSTGSIDFMACINNNNNNNNNMSNATYLQRVPKLKSMNAYLEDHMNSAFSNSMNNSNSSLVEVM